MPFRLEVTVQDTLILVPKRFAPPFNDRRRPAYSFVAVALTICPETSTTSSSLNESAANPCAGEKKLSPPPSNNPIATLLPSFD